MDRCSVCGSYIHGSSRDHKYNSRNSAVAPVIATLLMVAVAVAMSVIIFMWSQSFLAQTSESTGSQQGSQNQAAQSSIAIETIVNNGNGTITVLVRNVGAISVNLGSITVSSLSSNAGFKGSNIKTSGYNDAALSKGEGTAELSGALTGLDSGDVITVKVTTEAGTFAQTAYTIP